MEIVINVVGQKLRIETNLKIYVAGSQNFVKFIFNLSSDWDGLVTFAQFVQKDDTYNVFLTTIDGVDNCVYLPGEIKQGECKLLLYGYGHSKIATTNYLTLTIDRNHCVSDASSTDITKSLYEQLIDRFNQAIVGKVYAANTLSDMADESRIYVYVGNSTSTLTKGNWYYYDGDAWTSGGVYFATPIANATKSSKGIMQVGSGLNVNNGVVDVDTATIATRTYVDGKTQNATASSKGVMQVGNGLKANSGIVSVDTDIIAEKTYVDDKAEKLYIIGSDNKTYSGVLKCIDGKPIFEYS